MIMLLAELTSPNIGMRAILPELIVAVAGVLVMLYDSFVPRQRYVTSALSILALVLAGAALVAGWDAAIPATSWNGMIAHDNLRLGFFRRFPDRLGGHHSFFVRLARPRGHSGR